MAKVRFGAIVTDGSKKIGGHVFSHVRSGAVLQGKQAAQCKEACVKGSYRIYYKRALQKWTAMTESQRKAFLNGSMNGLSGFQLFMSVNMYSQLIGGPLVSTYSNDYADVVVSGVSSLVLTDASLLLSLNKTFTSSLYRILIYASKPLSAGRSNAGGHYRNIGYVASNASMPFNLNAMYEAAFPEQRKVGLQVFFKLTPVRYLTGKSFQSFYFSGIIS